MAFELNPVAVTAAALLRAIKAGDWTTKKDLAERAGRHPNHVQRDLKVLADNGLLNDGEPLTLTDEAEAQLAALDRASDPNAAGAPSALHADLEPHPLNPRKDFDTPEAEEALDELRVSIVKSGLLQPIVVRPRSEPGKWWIIAGERRWRAIGQAISDGDWEDDQPVAITIREVDDRDHLLLALNENLQRSNMSAIEEGVAFAAAVHDFGLSTDELSNRTGKSQRYVQQRIALLKLSQDDQDRMRLPRDHPSYLSFKDARAATQTARQPAPEVIEEPASDAEPTAHEPGSPAEAAAGAEASSLGKTLSDVEALILAEVADACGRQHHPIHPSYAFCLPAKPQAGIHHLVARELLAFRTIGDTTLVRTAQHSGGVKAWLESIGFYTDREGVLFELAARVQGAENVVNRQQGGVRYATAWLNLIGDPRNDAVEPAISRDYSRDAADALAYGMTSLEAEQPALIEETDEERKARLSAEWSRREAAADEEALGTFVGWMREKLAKKRAEGFSGWRNSGCASQVTPGSLAEQLVGHVAKGDPVDIAILSMMLGIRAGAMGAPSYLRSMPTTRMEELMIAARIPAPAEAEEGFATDPEYEAREAFVEAELDDAEAAIDPEEAATPRASAEPAVPIRKSITPDHIVCLEDGRKFKSLKRHLRTKYNLSPEEYRAKWGLAADYPMVAPNYAKARADLARQMGIAQ